MARHTRSISRFIWEAGIELVKTEVVDERKKKHMSERERERETEREREREREGENEIDREKSFRLFLRPRIADDQVTRDRQECRWTPNASSLFCFRERKTERDRERQTDRQRQRQRENFK